MTVELTAQELKEKLEELDLERELGEIIFSYAGTTVKIHTTDTVGNSIQSWLGQFMSDRLIYYREPESTQVFPDFYLQNTGDDKGLLEIKSFDYNKTPAFDIANFDSYCDSVKTHPYRLDADYMIFGYLMDDEGNISIKKIWLKKIWQIAGTSTRFPLKTQVKRDVIYNIRPEVNFKNDRPSTFTGHEDFLRALYGTILAYKGSDFATEWKNEMTRNYETYYSLRLSI